MSPQKRTVTGRKCGRTPPGSVPLDYDDPSRFRTARAVLRRHGPGDDVHPLVAQRLLDEGLTPVLDIGCGEGELARHLPDPRLALAEAARILRPGGMVAVSAPSSADAPELSEVLPRKPLTFDAEVAPDMLAELFTSVEVHRWDRPMIELPDAAAVRDYMVGRQLPEPEAERRARTVATPLTLTKRGALVFARRPVE